MNINYLMYYILKNMKYNIGDSVKVYDECKKQWWYGKVLNVNNIERVYLIEVNNCFKNNQKFCNCNTIYFYDFNSEIIKHSKLCSKLEKLLYWKE